MRRLRRNRRWIGSALAAVFVLAAIMPGVVAAAHGVQFQAHICSPDGAQMPDTGPLAHVAHEDCKLCPAGFTYVPASNPDRGGLFPTVSAAVLAKFPKDELPGVQRVELSPLNERGPPLQV